MIITVQWKMLAGENIGKFSYLDYLGEKTLVSSHQFAKFANLFSHQRFPLYNIFMCTQLFQCDALSRSNVILLTSTFLLISSFCQQMEVKESNKGSKDLTWSRGYHKTYLWQCVHITFIVRQKWTCPSSDNRSYTRQAGRQNISKFYFFILVEIFHICWV